MSQLRPFPSKREKSLQRRQATPSKYLDHLPCLYRDPKKSSTDPQNQASSQQKLNKSSSKNAKSLNPLTKMITSQWPNKKSTSNKLTISLGFLKKKIVQKISNLSLRKILQQLSSKSATMISLIWKSRVSESKRMLHRWLKTQGSIQAEPFHLEMISQPQANNKSRKGRAFRSLKKKRRDKVNKENKENISITCLPKTQKMKRLQ